MRKVMDALATVALFSTAVTLVICAILAPLLPFIVFTVLAFYFFAR